MGPTPATYSIGARLPRTEAVLEALVPAILEQKVTGTEAHRSWRELARRFGIAAPRTHPDRLGLGVLDPRAEP